MSVYKIWDTYEEEEDARTIEADTVADACRQWVKAEIECQDRTELDYELLVKKEDGSVVEPLATLKWDVTVTVYE